MAYEGSEIATAAALMFTTEELSKVKEKVKGKNTEDIDDFQETLKEAILRVKGQSKTIKKSKVGEVVFGPGGAKAGFMKLLEANNKDSFNDFAKGISAAISIRKYIRGTRGDTSPTKKVFMTGGTWPSEVEKFSLSQGNFNYNSSDILVNNSTSTKKEKYYGISLKKKPSKAAASPPLINKSLEKVLIQDQDFKKLLEKLNKFKYKYFADNLNKVITYNKKVKLGVGNPGTLLCLDGFTLPKNDKDIYNCTINHPFKTGNKNIRIISLKGMGVVKKKYDMKSKKDQKLAEMVFAIDPNGNKTSDTIPESKWKMRRYMNNTLYGGSKNPYWKEVLEILNTKSGPLAEKLVDLILKLNLYDKLKEKDIKKTEFDFCLTTGIGNVTPKGDVSIGNATTYPFKTLLCGYTRIQKHKDFVNTEWRLVVQDEKEIEADKKKIIEEEDDEDKQHQRAQIKFWLMKGEMKVLDLILRYKGKLGTPPQFTGTLHEKFIELLNDKCGKTV